MAKNKKDNKELLAEEDLDLNFDVDKSILDGIDSNDNMATNSMEYASIVSKPSNLSNQIKHVPKEVRYSFFDKNEVADIKHWDKNYRMYQYLKKVFRLQYQEDQIILKERAKLYTIKTINDLEEYCKNTHNLISFNKIKNDKEIIDTLLKHINSLNTSGFYEDLINQSESITDIYKKHKVDNATLDYIDDLGMAGNIMATSLVSMGRDGNERTHTIMSIQATKDMDVKLDQEKKTEYKNKIGGFINKFK